MESVLPLRAGTNCKTWLFKILFNEIHRYGRKWFTDKTIHQGDQSFEKMLAYEPPIHEEIGNEDVLAAVDEIPAEFREVVLMADVHEVAYKKIAETLNIPVATVMSRVNNLHVILTGGKGTILLLVITGKNGEAFNRADIAATMMSSGVPLYRANESQLEIAGFETNRYLAYVVSNLDRDGSLKVASDLASPVYKFLYWLEA
jgi:hypothetical protein